MRFVTFAVDGKSRPGVISGQTVSDLSTAGYASLLDFIESGPEGRTAAEKLAANGGGYPLDNVKLLAPIPRPRKLICVGLNYRDHAAETNSEMAIEMLPREWQTNIVICQAPSWRAR